MAKAKPWFRIHNTIVDNPKIQRLPDNLVRPWLNLVAIANGNGGVLPPLADVAFRMRLAESKCETLIETFLERRLFDKTPDGYAPHDWNDWQYQSDVSTDRVQKFRERHKQRPGNGARNVSVTASETDQRQRQIQKEEVRTPMAEISEGSGEQVTPSPEKPPLAIVAPIKPNPPVGEKTYVLTTSFSPVGDFDPERDRPSWMSRRAAE